MDEAPTLVVDPDALHAPLLLRAAMTWPNNADLQNKAIALAAAWGLDEAEADAAAAECLRAYGADPRMAPALSRQMRDEVAAAMFIPFGGYKAVVEAPPREWISAEMNKARKTVTCVGSVLCFAAQLAREDVGGSIRRAFAILAAEQGIEAPSDHSSFRRFMWNGWKSVAPLCAAQVVFWSMYPEARLEDHPASWGTPADLRDVLGWVQWFRRWATGYVPPQGREPLIPDWVAMRYRTDVPASEPPLARLAPDRLEVARTYFNQLVTGEHASPPVLDLAKPAAGTKAQGQDDPPQQSQPPR